MNIAELQSQVFYEDTKLLWVFAYGSLCWRPGFEFDKAVTGYVKGFHRRFWQGNITNRGTENKPGRVATLIEGQGKVHGIAFAISGEAALTYLSKRECKLGGYISQFTMFHPIQGEPFQALVYIANSQNPYWLGPSDEKTIAEQIINCEGPSGTNVEYVIRLAHFMREHFSDHNDSHLFKLEEEVLSLVASQRMCLKLLMGSGEECVTFIRKEKDSFSYIEGIKYTGFNSFQYAMKIQATKLRSLNL